MNHDDFQAAFENFAEKLYAVLGEDEKRVWTRYNKEFYNHKRNAEVSAWFGTGRAERGHVFLAKGDWDGTVDWKIIEQIVDNDELALGPDDAQIKVWDLAALKDQTEPRPRCSICGKLE